MISVNPSPPKFLRQTHRKKNPALRVWLAAFGIAVWLHVTAKLAIRIFFISTCIVLVSIIDGSLNLLVGHAVLRVAKHDGYDPPLPSSIQAGSLGGFVVIAPTTLAIVSLIALLGAGGGSVLKTNNPILSRHLAVLLELASATAVSSAAASAGVAVVRWIRPDDRPPLDLLHAARAGALGACILTAPIVATAAWLWMREPRTWTWRRRRTESVTDTPPAPAPALALTLTDGRGRPLTYDPSNSRARPRPRVITGTVMMETMGYVLVTLCILSIRLLCF